MIVVIIDVNGVKKGRPLEVMLMAVSRGHSIGLAERYEVSSILSTGSKPFTFSCYYSEKIKRLGWVWLNKSVQVGNLEKVYILTRSVFGAQCRQRPNSGCATVLRQSARDNLECCCDGPVWPLGYAFHTLALFHQGLSRDRERDSIFVIITDPRVYSYLPAYLSIYVRVKNLSVMAL